MKNINYDILKWVAIAALPALATLVGTVFQVWNIPNGEQLVTTINAIGVFLAAVLGVSSINYNKSNVHGGQTELYIEEGDDE